MNLVDVSGQGAAVSGVGHDGGRGIGIGGGVGLVTELESVRGEGGFISTRNILAYGLNDCGDIFVMLKQESTFGTPEKALVEGLEAGLQAAKSGNRACDIANALHETLARAGIERDARCGYPIGLSYPPDWGEHTLNIYKGDMTVLEPNVCFHMIAVMQFGDWGVEASEAIRVTDSGSELFCNFPKELHIKS